MTHNQGARRVTFVVNSYPPSSGGVQRHVEALAVRLAARGHDVHVVCLQGGPRPGSTVTDGVSVHRLHSPVNVRGIAGIPALGAWRRAVKAVIADSDVISVHTRFFPMSVLGVRAARRYGLPVVLTEHGSGHVATGSRVVDTGAWLVDRTVGRWAWRRATRVLAVSGRVADFVRAQSGRAAELFGNGVDTAAWRRTTPARPHLVFVGRLVPEKGWATFISIAHEVLASDPAATAVLLGDGPDLAAARSAAAATGLGGRLRVPGSVTPSSVADELAGAILVNPTLASEGYQLTLPETLAAGGRIVTYDVGGAVELAAAGAPVRVVDRGDPAALREAAAAEMAGPTPGADDAVVAGLDWDALVEEFEVHLRVASQALPGPA